MVDGVKRGDILMFYGWYMNPGAKEIMSIYNDARSEEKRLGSKNSQQSARR